MHYEYKYQDRIYIESDDGEEIPIWQNGERDSRWGHDNEADSEYHKMLELDSQYDFTNYDRDDLPCFVHRVIEKKYKVTKEGKTLVGEESVDYRSLVEEFFNT